MECEKVANRESYSQDRCPTSSEINGDDELWPETRSSSASSELERVASAAFGQEGQPRLQSCSTTTPNTLQLCGARIPILPRDVSLWEDSLRHVKYRRAFQPVNVNAPAWSDRSRVRHASRSDGNAEPCTSPCRCAAGISPRKQPTHESHHLAKQSSSENAGTCEIHQATHHLPIA